MKKKKKTQLVLLDLRCSPILAKLVLRMAHWFPSLTCGKDPKTSQQTSLGDHLRPENPSIGCLKMAFFSRDSFSTFTEHEPSTQTLSINITTFHNLFPLKAVPIHSPGKSINMKKWGGKGYFIWPANILVRK